MGPHCFPVFKAVRPVNVTVEINSFGAEYVSFAVADIHQIAAIVVSISKVVANAV